MDRIDAYPTHTIGGFKVRPGKPLPFGATLASGGGVNFSVYSRHAVSCELVLFKKGEKEPYASILFPEEFRIGHVFAMVVFDLDDIENIEYGYRMDGPNDFSQGHWFNKDKVLLDPYAKAIGGRDVWGVEPDWNDKFQHRGRLTFDDFDWEGDKPLETPMEDLVIYEAHVRGFTRHESSGIGHPGTFAGLREKIPYLKELGINCIELMPVYEFDEFENSRFLDGSSERLMNYWGYSTVGFLAPKAGYAATGKLGMQVDEFKTLVKELHKAKIEVILDVVFNHTAEGNENGPYISFRGIDNKTYYILTPEGYYYNFSGCGNTLNCNNPIVRGMIIDALRYWVSEYHVDGFRFDLASILGRDAFGAPMANPPLLEAMAFDPILGRSKLIAEAWDAGGLYQVGSFWSFGRWAEWNGKYRDGVRKFIKGETGVGDIAQRVQGSPDLYEASGRGTVASINFVTCHDGFTLMDTVSYDGKHNDANGENNNDGNNDNDSWNCGWEGPSTDPSVNWLRQKQIKNVATLLMVSQGVPMILSGDEMGNTQWGNNNAYCQDNPISWLDWSGLENYKGIFDFYKKVIAFRHAHPVLRNCRHFRNCDYAGSGLPDISWHGTRPWNVDWGNESRTLAFLLCGRHAKQATTVDDHIYVAMNMHWEMHGFGLPYLPDGRKWHMAINTDMASPDDIWPVGMEPLLDNQGEVLVAPRTIVVLVGK